MIVKLLNIIVKYLIDCQIYDKFYFLIFSKTNNQAIIKFDAWTDNTMFDLMIRKSFVCLKFV